MDSLYLLPPWFLPVSTFLFGSIVGSFLNVCIFRMPEGKSIVFPGSHCGACKKPIAWYDNIPLFSYLLLRGKCRHCKAGFSPRYWIVEFITAITFMIIWQAFPPVKAIAYMIFFSGLLVATFIDLKYYIIPNEITLGGIATGILLSGIFPILQNSNHHLSGFLWSLGGAAAGFLSLWLVVELGKKMFGEKKLELPEPTLVKITEKGIHIGEDFEVWEEIFSRETDTLRLEATSAKMADRAWETATVGVNWKEIKINDETFPLEKASEFSGLTRCLTIPREAMGFGDVKFIAAMGAFLGPQSIFLIILVSSIAGSVVGLATMLIGKREWGMKIPFGPYLALGALVWIFGGSHWFHQYLQWMRP